MLNKIADMYVLKDINYIFCEINKKLNIVNIVQTKMHPFQFESHPVLEDAYHHNTMLCDIDDHQVLKYQASMISN